MKTFMITTAIAALMSTAVMAEDFGANEFITTAHSGALQFSVGTVDGDISTFTTGASIANYSIGNFETNIYTSLAYGRFTNSLDLTLEYNVQTALNGQWNVYGSAALSYVTPTNDLTVGNVFAAPSIGISYAVNENLNVFGDVTYTWNASDSWVGTGGAIEVGFDYTISDRVSIIPSVVRTFDTDADATNLKLEVAFSF